MKAIPALIILVLIVSAITCNAWDSTVPIKDRDLAQSVISERAGALQSTPRCAYLESIQEVRWQGSSVVSQQICCCDTTTGGRCCNSAPQCGGPIPGGWCR